jgi:hypothetical protein
VHDYPLRLDTVPPPRSAALIDEQNERMLFSTGRRRYLATLHRTALPASSARPPKPETQPTTAETAENPVLAHHLRYGSRSSFIVDMQGIDSFLHGRAKHFSDHSARRAAADLGLVESGSTYLRVGAAGAPPAADHPGGEVLEDSILTGPRLGGWSRSVCGHLPERAEFSSSVPLALPGSTRHLERRSIYSHTAFLRATDGDDNANTVLRLAGRPGGLNVLDEIRDCTAANGWHAFAIRIFAVASGAPEAPIVVGRVLRRLPRRRLRNVAEAAAIASEQTFTLEPGQRLWCFGTYHRRVEPDWERFRDGRPYEPRGHLHMSVEGPTSGQAQHQVSHLRDLHLTPGNECHVLLTPIERVVRIDPIVLRDKAIVSRASGRTIGSFDPSQWTRTRRQQ